MKLLALSIDGFRGIQHAIIPYGAKKGPRSIQPPTDQDIELAPLDSRENGIQGRSTVPTPRYAAIDELEMSRVNEGCAPRVGPPVERAGCAEATAGRLWCPVRSRHRRGVACHCLRGAPGPPRLQR